MKYNQPVCGLVLAHEETTWWAEGPSVGHLIYFDKYNVRTFTLGGIEFFIIPETACLAISEEPLRFAETPDTVPEGPEEPLT